MRRPAPSNQISRSEKAHVVKQQAKDPGDILSHPGTHTTRRLVIFRHPPAVVTASDPDNVPLRTLATLREMSSFRVFTMFCKKLKVLKQKNYVSDYVSKEQLLGLKAINISLKMRIYWI